MHLDYSVIVITYHPSFEKLKKTLYSIIIQEDINFEIIVADDGSEQNFFSEINEWFKQNKFEQYKLVENKKNQGTVKNIISALQVASGRIVKCISPGDFLYDKKTLFKYKKHMENEQLYVCFGKTAYFSINGKECQFYSKHNPTDLSVYRKRNQKKILRNYIAYADFPVGASFVVDRTVFQKYISIISDKVTYCEDTSYLMMINDGYEMGFLDEYIVWYEYGSGISTQVSSKWKKIIDNEVKSVYEIMSEKDKLAKKGYKFLYDGVENYFIDMVRKILLSPAYLLLLLKTKYCKEAMNFSVENLEQIILYEEKRNE